MTQTWTRLTSSPPWTRLSTDRHRLPCSTHDHTPRSGETTGLSKALPRSPSQVRCEAAHNVGNSNGGLPKTRLPLEPPAPRHRSMPPRPLARPPLLSQPPPVDVSVQFAQLARLGELPQQGVLTHAEFDEQEACLLGR